jgi:hypothetical protein
LWLKYMMIIQKDSFQKERVKLRKKILSNSLLLFFIY